jgi:Transposase IS116/IS110/IS902 family
MTRFPSPGRLASWTGLCGRTIQSGSRTRNGKGQGNAWLRGYLGQAAIAAARTNTFLGERYRRIARHRGAARAQVAVARSILIIVWHLLSDPTARYHDLGPGHYRQEPQGPQPHPPARSPRLHRHHHPGRLTQPLTTSPAGHKSRLRRRCRAPS